jgi:hypothetical protein
LARLPRSRTAPAYERRLILFVDFLGFREVVADTETDPAMLARLVAALDDIGRLGEAEIFRSQRVTQFSDSVVMSYRITEQSGVFWMINAIALTIISLAERGFLLRGAVTLGDLYHTGRHVVGPAMVHAYEMESQLARYPRVIVDPAVIRLARRRRNEDHSPDDEERYIRDFITEDEDGQLFIDYISWNAVVAVAGADDEGYPDYLATLCRLLRSGLAHSDPRVAEKYLWLHPRYLAAVDLVRSLPLDSPYRLHNPGNCEAIESLPRMVSLARASQLRVRRRRASRPGPVGQ